MTRVFRDRLSVVFSDLTLKDIGCSGPVKCLERRFFRRQDGEIQEDHRITIQFDLSGRKISFLEDDPEWGGSASMVTGRSYDWDDLGRLNACQFRDAFGGTDAVFFAWSDSGIDLTWKDHKGIKETGRLDAIPSAEPDPLFGRFRTEPGPIHHQGFRFEVQKDPQGNLSEVLQFSEANEWITRMTFDYEYWDGIDP